MLKKIMTKENFFKTIKLKIKKSNSNYYSLVSFDIDNFNFVNDFFNYAIGDIVLKKIIERIESFIEEDEYFCQINADHFIMLLKNNNNILIKIQDVLTLSDLVKEIIQVHYNIVFSGGIVNIVDVQENLQLILDKANFTRKHAKGNHKNTFLLYDKKMHEELEWKKIITLHMEKSLKNQEFVMFLQPKILIKTNEIIGAEALVRWNSPDFGLILPERFITIFEENGFIEEIDFFMLKQACIFVENQIYLGKKAVPISVNFSKIHLLKDSFVDKIYEEVKMHNISANYIEIELTESVFLDDFERMKSIINKLKEFGFKVSLDDFGKAYSSLNYLKELPLDIVKIDRGFLNSTKNDLSSKLILVKIIELIKSLSLVPLMEGIETKEQLDFIADLDCDLGQGFLFAKPMQVAEFKKALDENFSFSVEICDKIVYREDTRNKTGQEFFLDNKELYHIVRNVDFGLIKICFKEPYKIEYINDYGLKLLDSKRDKFDSEKTIDLESVIYHEDLSLFRQNLEKALQNKISEKFELRILTENNGVIPVYGKINIVQYNLDAPMGLFLFYDINTDIDVKLESILPSKITELEKKLEIERENVKKLQEIQENYKMVIDQSDDIMFEWDFETDTILFSDKFEKIFGHHSINNNASTSKKIKAIIHPEDFKVFDQWIKDTYKKNHISTSEFRIRSIKGDYFWIKSYSTTKLNENNIPIKAIGAFSNINSQKLEMDRLTFKSTIDSLTKIYNKGESRRLIEEFLMKNDKYSAFLIIDVDNFKGINDNLGHQFGDKVLKKIANTIKIVFGEENIIGRLGGDEIIVFCSTIKNKKEVIEICEVLLTRIRTIYFGTNSKYDVTCSVGVSIFPDDGKNFEDLYHFSDIALYESKNTGKDKFTCYHENLNRLSQDLRTPVESQELFLSNYFSNDFIFDIFEMLYETSDLKTTISKVLEIMGENFKVDRVYIFEIDQDNNTFSNSFEWCDDGINAQIHNLQKLSIDEFQDFFSAYNREGILALDDIITQDNFTFDFLIKQGIKSLLQCQVSNEGKKYGFIGFDVCREYRQWKKDEIAILAYLSRILSIFLTKKKNQ